MTVDAYTHTHTPCGSHVTRTKWVTSHIYMKHCILHSVSNRDCQLIHTMSESCHRYKWVTSHAWTSHVPSNQHIIRHRFSIRGCLCVHSMNVSHVSYTNKSRLTYGRVTSPLFNTSFRIVSAFASVYRTILSCHEWVLQCLVYHAWVWQCWVWTGSLASEFSEWVWWDGEVRVSKRITSSRHEWVLQCLF